jgi:glutathione S-transferase
MYTVIGATKTRAFRVMWMLEELGQDYIQIDAGPRSEEALKYNPSGKIPALLDGDDILTDSVAKHSFAFPEELRVPAVKESAKAEFARSADVLADRLDGPYLVGDTMTHADILACHCINWSIGANFPRVDDRLAKWAASMSDRPAFKAAQAKIAG